MAKDDLNTPILDANALEGLISQAEHQSSTLSEKTIYELISKLFDFENNGAAITFLTRNQIRFFEIFETENELYYKKFVKGKNKHLYDNLIQKFQKYQVSLGGLRAEQVVKAFVQTPEPMRVGIGDRIRDIFGGGQQQR